MHKNTGLEGGKDGHGYCKNNKKNKLEIKIDNPDALREAYEMHQSWYPGEYRVNERADSEHNESFRSWVRYKIDLADRLRVAECLKDFTGKAINSYRHGHDFIQTTHHVPLSSNVKYLLDLYKADSERIKLVDPLSTVWRSVRNSLYRTRSRLKKIIEDEHISIPDFVTLPPIPPLPLIARRSPHRVYNQSGQKHLQSDQ